MHTPFYGGFGLISADHIEKPIFHAFHALHFLGEKRIALNSESALATLDAQGRLVLALWNYAPPVGEGASYTMPKGPAGPPRTFELDLKDVSANARVEVMRVDEDHGNVLKAFDAMGRPPGSLTQEQIKQLQAAAAMAPPEHPQLQNGKLSIIVPAYGLAVVTVGP